MAVLLVYNQLSTGHLFNPAYDYLYQIENVPIPGGMLPGLPRPAGHRLPPGTWSMEDIGHVPLNALIMFAWLPSFRRIAAVEGLFSTACAVIKPDQAGMSILLTSPAYLLALPALVRIGAPAGHRVHAGAWPSSPWPT